MGSDASSSSVPDLRTHLRALGGTFAVVALVFILASIAVALGYPLLDAAGIARESALGLALRSAFQFVGFGVAGIGFLAVTDQLDLVPVRRPTRGDLKWLAIGFAALLALYFSSSAILSALGRQGADSLIAEQGSGQPIYYLYLIPVTVLLVGPTEELVFRGIVQGLFRRAYGTRVAIIAASGIFAAVHLSSYSGDGLFVTLGMILVLGGTLGVVYEKSENLVVPAVVHGLFNTAQFAGLYATETGLIG